MRKLIVTVLAILLVVPAFAQNPVEEAKAKKAKERHELMVEHAKHLLERKESLEKELAEVDAKLQKLSSGEDVAEDGVNSGPVFTTCCIAATTCNLAGCAITGSTGR